MALLIAVKSLGVVVVARSRADDASFSFSQVALLRSATANR